MNSLVLPLPLSTLKAGCRHRANFGECPLLEDEPPFLAGTSPPSKRFLLFSHLLF